MMCKNKKGFVLSLVMVCLLGGLLSGCGEKKEEKQPVEETSAPQNEVGKTDLSWQAAEEFLNGDGESGEAEYEEEPIELTEEMLTEYTYVSTCTKLGEYKGLSYVYDENPVVSQADVEAEAQGMLEFFEGAEMTDAFVSENLGYASVDEYYEMTRNDMIESMKADSLMEAIESMQSSVVEASTIDLKQEDVEREYNWMMNSYTEAAAEYEMTMEEFATEFFEEDVAAMEKEVRESAEDIVKTYVVADAILEAEGVDFEKEKVAVEQEMMEENYCESREELIANMGDITTLNYEIKYRMAGDILLKYGKNQL